MKMMILRRKKLGFGSAKGLAMASSNISSVRNDMMGSVDWDSVSHVIRWGCTSTIPRRSNGERIPVVNEASAIHTVNNKAGFRIKMQEAHPDITPPSVTKAMLDGGAAWPPFPLILRPEKHSRGLNVHVANSTMELVQAIGELPSGWYASTLLPKQAEYRVYVVEGRAVWVCSKEVEDPSSVTWNRATTGAEFVNVRWDSWPIPVVVAAIKAFNLSGLDFGGVDVIVSDGRPYVLEINSAASLPLYEGEVSYRQRCVAKAFDWHYENGWDPIETGLDGSSYRDLIHPAMVADHA